MKPPTWLTLDRLANWLTFGVVVIAFALSFGALKDLAADVGIIYPALYPVMIDAGLVIYNIMALQSSLKGERNRYAWFLIILATTASVFLNVVHSLDEPPPWLTAILGSAMAAIPPLVIFGAFHLVVLRIEQNARHRQLAQTAAELDTAIYQRSAEREQVDEEVRRRLVELDNLNKTIQTRTADRDTLAVQVEQLTAELNLLRQKQQPPVRTPVVGDERPANGHVPPGSELPNKQKAMELLLAFVAIRPDSTLSDIGQVIGRSKSTVSAYMSELIQANRLVKNGHGWEVLNGDGSETAANDGWEVVAESEQNGGANTQPS